jgi:hypothetical protein
VARSSTRLNALVLRRQDDGESVFEMKTWQLISIFSALVAGVSTAHGSH